MLKQKILLPVQTDDYTLRFWFASLEASWRRKPLDNEWDMEKLNWPYLLWAGRFHRVTAGFATPWQNLQHLPDAVSEELWMARAMAEQYGKAVQTGLEDLRSIIRKHSLKLAVLKSPSYILEAFSTFKDRLVDDVDVLARKDDIKQLYNTLTSLGYQCTIQRRQFVFERGITKIEVHLEAANHRRFWRLLPPEWLLERAVPVPRLEPLFRLSTPDEAVVLALHAYHHNYEQAIWLRDIAAWWAVRKPDPSEIFDAFQHIGLAKIGWVTWVGMQKIGWQMPQSWNPQLWHCNDNFCKLTRRYWEQNALRIRNSLNILFLRRSLEFHQAQGIIPKLMSCTPWFSLRSCKELYRAWKGIEKGPGKKHDPVKLFLKTLIGEASYVESKERCGLEKKG